VGEFEALGTERWIVDGKLEVDVANDVVVVEAIGGRNGLDCFQCRRVEVRMCSIDGR